MATISQSSSANPPKSLNPNAHPFKPTETTNHVQYAASSFLFYKHFRPPIYGHRPRSVWIPVQSCFSHYDANLQPVPVSFKTYFTGIADGDSQNTVKPVSMKVMQPSDDFGRNRKYIKRVKKFVSPRFRVQENKKQWLPVKKDPTSDDDDHSDTKFKKMLCGKTSIMIKNIPNQFERYDLMKILDEHCRHENYQANLRSDPCRSEYDFVYLPMDFGFFANLGYAFVNFTTASAALRFTRAFNNYEWKQLSGNKKKICEISVAKIQGKQALRSHFERSYFPCHTNRYLPVVLTPPRDGVNDGRPTIVGKCTGFGSACPPVKQRKFILMEKNKPKQTRR